MRRSRVYRSALTAAALVALLSTLAFGLHGLGRPGLPQLDFLAYYGAGELLLEHETPYGVPRTPPRMAAQGEQSRVFAYPPNTAPLVIPFATTSYRAARYAFNALNVIAVVAFGLGVGLLAMTSRRGRESARPLREAADGEALLSAGLIALVAWSPPYASHSLWFGNVEAATLALLVWAWWLEHRGRSALAGVLLGIAAIKPPTVLLAGIWLLLRRRWTTLAVTAGVVLVMALPMMMMFGVWGAWADWLRGMAAYAATPENLPTGEGTIGLRSFLAAVGVSVPDLTILALIAALLLWRYARPLSPMMSLALLVATSLVFFDGHMPALLGLAVVAGGWLEVMGTGAPSMTAGAVALVAFLTPREALRLLHAPEWVLRYRTVELLIVALVMVYAISRHRRERAPSNEAVEPAAASALMQMGRSR